MGVETIEVIRNMTLDIRQQNRKVGTVYLGYDNMLELRTLGCEYFDWIDQTVLGYPYLEVRAEYHIHVSMEAEQ